MTIHHRPTKAVRGRRAFVRLSVPIGPSATPRAALEAQAAFLIDLLDRMDPDLEPDSDLELECEDEGAQCDDEGDNECDGDQTSEDEPLFPVVSLAAYDAQRDAASEASRQLRAVTRRKRRSEPSSVGSNVGPLIPLFEIAPGVHSSVRP